MPTDSDYQQFVMNSQSDSVELDLIEISSPHFSKVYRYVNNAGLGVDLTLNGEVVHFEYMPFVVRESDKKFNLDSELSLALPGGSEDMSREVERLIRSGAINNPSKRPIFKRWFFSSKNLTQPALTHPELEVFGCQRDHQKSVIQCGSSNMKSEGIGMFATIDQFPMLADV